MATPNTFTENDNLHFPGMAPEPRGPRQRTVGDWFGALRDGWPALVLCVVIGLAIGAIATSLQSTAYQADSTVATTPARGFLDPTGADALPALTDAVARLVTSPSVAQATAAEYAASSNDPAERAARSRQATFKWVNSHVTATQQGQSNLLTISATAPTQREARDLSSAAADALTRVMNSEPRQKDNGLVVRGFRTIDQGQVSPTPGLNLAIGGNAGLIIGLVAALLMGLRYRRVRNPQEIVEELGVPLLGVVRTAAKRSLSPADPGLAAARARLQALGRDDTATIVLLTGTAKSDRIAEVGEALVRSFSFSSRALLVDADLSAQVVTRRLALTRQPGLAELIDGSSQANGRAALPRFESASKVEVLPAGQPTGDPATTLTPSRLAGAFDSLRDEYDFVVIVAPSLSHSAELISLLASVDAAVAVAPRGQREQKLAQVHELGDALAGRLIGALVLSRG